MNNTQSLTNSGPVTPTMTPTPLTLSRETYGGAIRIGIQGQPKDVLETVNLFYNHGIARSIPEDYNEGSDYNVTVMSNRKHLIRGLISIAHNKLKTRNRYFRREVPVALTIFHASRELSRFRRAAVIENRPAINNHFSIGRAI